MAVIPPGTYTVTNRAKSRAALEKLNFTEKEIKNFLRGGGLIGLQSDGKIVGIAKEGLSAEQSYNNLRDTLMGKAIVNNDPNKVIALSMKDVNTMVDHMRNETKGEPKHLFMSEKYRLQFSSADTFLYRAKDAYGDSILLSQKFSLEGRVYHGGEINYLAVGMLASHYGGLSRMLLDPMVTKWNYDQYRDGEGDHNLSQIYYGNQWTKYGAYRF